jgi:hypothetical protein
MLWREAQQRRREKLARLGITGRRKAHKPSSDHPWVKDTGGFKDVTQCFEEEERPVSITFEVLRKELGL